MSTITSEKSSKEKQLVQSITNVVDQFKKAPEKARATFSTNSRLDDGFRAVIDTGDLQFIADEPESLGGQNEGPNPVEYVLGALAACQEIAVKAHAALLDIEVTSVETTVEGDIDLQGFFDLGDKRPGFENISYQTVIETKENDSDKLDQLKELSAKNCPVLDIIKNPTPVKGNTRFIS